MVVDVQFEPGMALGDPAELGEMPAGHRADREFSVHQPLASVPSCSR
jgi:hypothetical protein